MKNQIAYFVGVSSLQNVLNLSLRLKVYYEALETNAQSNRVKYLIGLKKSYNNELLETIQNLLVDYRVAPVKQLGIFKNFCFLWSALKLEISEPGDDFILEKSYRLDNRMIDMLTNEIRTGQITDKTYDVYTMHINRLYKYASPLTIQLIRTA